MPALFALLLAASAAAPLQIEGVAFAGSVEVGSGRLELRNVGLLRYRIFFKGYVAALYLPPATPTGAALSDVPKRLEIEYFWPIDAEAFGAAAEALLARQLPEPELRRLKPRIARLHRLYRDVEPGDRYALSYLPGVGTELTLNGARLGVVPGADLARAYFGIWLGEAPLDESLRDQLLADP